VDIEVEYEYLNNYEDGSKYPLYDVMTQTYFAFLHYDRQFLKEMLEELKKIRIIYRVKIRPSNKLYANLLECHQWVVIIHIIGNH